MDEWFWEMRKLEEPKMIYDVKLYSWGKCGISEEESILEGRGAVLCAPPPSLGCREDSFLSLLLYVESQCLG